MSKLGRNDLLGIGFTSQRRRDQLLDRLQAEGVRHPEVLRVMRNMPRHLFVDEAMANRAYEDCALPIGFGQTISQPFIVARMTEAIIGGVNEVRPKKVLEIGTGSGYQAAILSMLVEQVYSIERIEPLYQRSSALLKKLQLDNVEILHGDGTLGWPDKAPYDAIIVTAAPEDVPDALYEQLAEGGRIIVPLGKAGSVQRLTIIRKTEDGLEPQELELVSFVPFLSGRN
ncbi:MAG: protein-L-isoaspartate(D-aspartate) O-methyltransferase [Gammaproteobacteria bacterium]|nr:protein-L-isoaspartate(D-aspartate) O-methyltransferase [Gammaproteobacteria bacterium]